MIKLNPAAFGNSKSFCGRTVCSDLSHNWNSFHFAAAVLAGAINIIIFLPSRTGAFSGEPSSLQAS